MEAFLRRLSLVAFSQVTDWMPRSLFALLLLRVLRLRLA
jgi:hypothetical protein